MFLDSPFPGITRSRGTHTGPFVGVAGGMGQGLVHRLTASGEEAQVRLPRPISGILGNGLAVGQEEKSIVGRSPDRCEFPGPRESARVAYGGIEVPFSNPIPLKI